MKLFKGQIAIWVSVIGVIGSIVGVLITGIFTQNNETQAAIQIERDERKEETSNLKKDVAVLQEAIITTKTDVRDIKNTQADILKLLRK